jgi:hypothetical protein
MTRDSATVCQGPATWSHSPHHWPRQQDGPSQTAGPGGGPSPRAPHTCSRRPRIPIQIRVTASSPPMAQHDASVVADPQFSVARELRVSASVCYVLLI